MRRRAKAWRPSPARWKTSGAFGSPSLGGRTDSTTTPRRSGRRGAPHCPKARSRKTLGRGSRCLVFIGAADADFLDEARRAASEIPDAEFISLDELDHYGAHSSPESVVLDAILRTLRGG